MWPKQTLTRVVPVVAHDDGPWSDVEFSADDIVWLTDKGQGTKAIYSSLGPRRGNPSPACLLDYGVSRDYKVADGFGVLCI